MTVVSGNDDSGKSPSTSGVKCPPAGLNAYYGFIGCETPGRSVRIYSSNAMNPLVWIHSIGLFNTCNFNILWHN